ncbi:MAG: hypothetical protein PHN56_02760 [Candidatus Nanoarchaeia archaeon]|nr:hypothetical protein [Candidatus Nanoarchaeia archaeon]
MDKNFQIIIPELVSFDTKLDKLKGFNLSEDFNFYKSQTKKEKFHYSLIVKNDIEIPKSYEFRNGYYFKYEDCWYYERKIIPGISLKFKYDLKNRIFYFNRSYSLIPFEIGGILPIGKHISDFINLDLFLNNYNVIRGCAFAYRGKNVIIISPIFNGKTTLLKDILIKGGKYIAEDLLIINFFENKIYPSSPHLWNYSRKINKELSGIDTHQIIDNSRNIDQLNLLQNSIKPEMEYKPSKDLLDYLLINSLFFLTNLMLRSFIVEEGLSKKVMKKIGDISKIKKYSFLNINDFKYFSK